MMIHVKLTSVHKDIPERISRLKVASKAYQENRDYVFEAKASAGMSH